MGRGRGKPESKGKRGACSCLQVRLENAPGGSSWLNPMHHDSFLGPANVLGVIYFFFVVVIVLQDPRMASVTGNHHRQ